MQFLRGPISDRLRAMFSKDDPGWNPPSNRQDNTRQRGKLPKNVEGKNLGKKGRKGGD